MSQKLDKRDYGYHDKPYQRVSIHYKTIVMNYHNTTVDALPIKNGIRRLGYAGIHNCRVDFPRSPVHTLTGAGPESSFSVINPDGLSPDLRPKHGT